MKKNKTPKPEPKPYDHNDPDERRAPENNDLVPDEKDKPRDPKNPFPAPIPRDMR